MKILVNFYDETKGFDFCDGEKVDSLISKIKKSFDVENDIKLFSYSQ